MKAWRLIETVWLLVIITVSALVMYALTGCASTPCVRPIVEWQRPALPTVPAADLQCLSDDTYRALALRDVLLHQAVEECEVIVRELAEVPQ